MYPFARLQVYKGYVDDPRNTDNAWMETVACNFHDETGEVFGEFQLRVCYQFNTNSIKILLHSNTLMHTPRVALSLQDSKITFPSKQVVSWVKFLLLESFILRLGLSNIVTNTVTIFHL